MVLEGLVDDDVQGEHLSRLNMVANLPADRASLVQEARTLRNHLRLIVIELFHRQVVSATCLPTRSL